MPVWQMNLSRNHCFSIPLDPKHNHFKTLTPFFSRCRVNIPIMCCNYLKLGFHMVVSVASNVPPAASKRMENDQDDPYVSCFLNGRFCRYTGSTNPTILYARSIYKLKMAAVNDVLLGIKRSFAKKQERNAGSADFGLEPYTEIFLCRMAHSSSFSEKVRSPIECFCISLWLV